MNNYFRRYSNDRANDRPMAFSGAGRSLASINNTALKKQAEIEKELEAQARENEVRRQRALQKRIIEIYLDKRPRRFSEFMGYLTRANLKIDNDFVVTTLTNVGIKVKAH
jgi:hypothetical protein